MNAIPSTARREGLLLKHRLGIFYYGLGDLVQAIACFRECVTEQPGFVAAKVCQGSLRIFKGRPADNTPWLYLAPVHRLTVMVRRNRWTVF